jgi:hypothetical protein
MPPRGSKRVISETAVEEENDENVPPQNRRSGRMRKNASKSDTGLTTEICIDEDVSGHDEENEDEEDEDEDDVVSEEEIEKPKKRAKKTPSPKSTRKTSGSKTNGVSKSKAKTPKKPRKSGTAEVVENTSECPMLGNEPVDRLIKQKLY